MNQPRAVAHGVRVHGVTGLLRWARSFSTREAGHAAPRLLAAALAEAGNVEPHVHGGADGRCRTAGSLDPRAVSSLAPERLPRTLLHAVLAFAVLTATPSLLDESAPLKGIFLIVLPALVYALLGTIWMLRQAQTAFGMR